MLQCFGNKERLPGHSIWRSVQRPAGRPRHRHREARLNQSDTADFPSTGDSLHHAVIVKAEMLTTPEGQIVNRGNDEAVGNIAIRQMVVTLNIPQVSRAAIETD